MKKSVRQFSGIIWSVFLLFAFYSCTKNDSGPESTSATFTVIAKSGTNDIIWDSINNVNAAGNPYSVTTLNFYISNVTLRTSNGETYTSDTVFFIDPSNVSKNSFKLDSIPNGDYTEMSFNVGLDTTHNKSFYLETTTDNLIMAWPDAMGGGYHFMKLEGHYLDTMNVDKGFAIHLGKNANLVLAKINQNLNQKNQLQNYSLVFDINEVFANPYTYNFNFDKNYTMSDSVAMNRIKNNMSDAFSLIQNNN